MENHKSLRRRYRLVPTRGSWYCFSTRFWYGWRLIDDVSGRQEHRVEKEKGTALQIQALRFGGDMETALPKALGAAVPINCLVC